MGTLVPEARLQRARRLAENAPTGKGVTLRKISNEALSWSTEGPGNLVEVLQEAKDLHNAIATLDGSITEAQKAIATAQQELESIIDTESYPALSALITSTDNELDKYAEERKLVVTLLREREHLLSKRKRVHDESANAPQRVTKERTELQERKDVLEAEIADLKAKIEETDTSLLSAAAERQEVELLHENATHRLRDLGATVSVVLSHVEQEHGPVAAARLYNQFREATHYREYKLEAEKSRDDARKAREQQQQLENELHRQIDSYNQLVEEYNALLGQHDDTRRQLKQELQAADEANETIVSLQNEIGELREEIDKLLELVDVARARATPVTSHLPASTHGPLIQKGILTYEQLEQHSRESLLEVNGLGPSKVQQIEHTLANAGLHLKA